MENKLDTTIQGDPLSSNEISHITEAIKNELGALVNLPIEAKSQKNEDIKSMILYYGDQTKTIEDRRTRLAEFSWQSLALAITAFAIIIALSIFNLYKGLVLIFLGVIIFFSLLKIAEYHFQSAFRYPFLKFPDYSNKWKWFYYGNPYITKINTNPCTYINKRYFGKDQLNYLQGLNKFVENYTTENIDKELEDNIIQLYLLQVHNYYKNQFYLRLLKYDKYTPIIIFALLIVYLIVVLILISVYPGYKDYFFAEKI